MSEPEVPYLRHGVKKTYKELQEEARALVHESGLSQQDVADQLDISRSTIAKAVSQPGPRYHKAQIRIVELLTDYRVEREETVRFRHVKKAEDER